MAEVSIQQLVDDVGPLPENADAGTLRTFLEGSRLTRAEQQRVLAFLTQPALRLIWAHPPEAGHDCVQLLEVRLPPTFRGLQPRLHVGFPQTLPVQVLPGSEPVGTGDLLGVVAGGREHWRQLPLQLQNAVPDELWRADLQFRLPAQLQGAYLWKFRIDFLNSWGHAGLPRFFGADYSVQMGVVNGETTLEISAGDFSSVTLPDLARWQKVKINLAGNAKFRQPDALPDYDAWFRGTGNRSDTATEGVVIDTTIRQLQLPDSRRVVVVTPYVPAGVWETGMAGGGIRGAWPEVATARLTLRSAGSQAVFREFCLHASDELRLGRRSEYQDKQGRMHRNHIVTDFCSEDFPGLDAEQLRERRATISSANTTLLISAGQLTVRNTGSPGSDYPGLTEVSWQQGGQQQQELLDGRNQEQPFDLRKMPVRELKMVCGGSPDSTENLPGYQLDLTPVRAWDDTSSHTWDDPQSLSEQIGKLPKQARSVNEHGLDALLVTPRPPQQPPGSAPRQQHVLLLRQLWLGADGLAIDDPAQVNPRQRAAVRLLTAGRENSRGQVLLLQLLSDRHQLTVRSAPEAAAMQVPTFGIVPLKDDDTLTLSANGAICWTGSFEVLER